jgi:hypothetical protein
VDVLTTLRSQDLRSRMQHAALPTKREEVKLSLRLINYATGFGLEPPRSRSCPGRVRNFLFASYGPALVPARPSIRWVLGVLSPEAGRLGREAYNSPPRLLTRSREADLCIHSSIRLHGVVGA